VRKQTNGSYLVDGSVTLRDLNREFDWPLPDDKASTVAGFLLYEARTIPEPGQPGSETWGGGDSWKRGGGPTWVTGSFDPELGLLYWGVGNPAPDFNGDVRPGDNLYTDSVVALDVETGELKWHFQVVPGDSWDFDSVQHLVLADLPIGGRTRKVIMQANKDAFFYVIDRVTGQFISAAPFSQVTWASGLDPKTGRPIVNKEAYYGAAATLVTPGGGGAHNWSPMAFNPMTGLTYVPTSTLNTFSYATERATMWQDSFSSETVGADYGLVEGGVGFVIRGIYSAQVLVAVPFRIGGSVPRTTLGVALGVNFGAPEF
jgi:hypothetical protein